MKKSESLQFSKKAAQAADDKLGQEILILDVSRESSLADYFVFITGTSHTHIRAMEDGIRDALKATGAFLNRTDGQRGHVWRVLDYGAIIIHIMDAKTRSFYAIEKLWERGRPVEWEAATKEPAKKSAARKAAAKKPAVKKKNARAAAVRRAKKKK